MPERIYDIDINNKIKMLNRSDARLPNDRG